MFGNLGETKVLAVSFFSQEFSNQIPVKLPGGVPNKVLYGDAPTRGPTNF